MDGKPLARLRDGKIREARRNLAVALEAASAELPGGTARLEPVLAG